MGIAAIQIMDVISEQGDTFGTDDQQRKLAEAIEDRLLHNGVPASELMEQQLFVTFTEPSVEQVRHWYECFQVPFQKIPTVMPLDRFDLRMNLLQEELGELIEAHKAGDLQAMLDAFCDLQFLLDGGFLESGFGAIKPWAMTEVYRSNMSKLDDAGNPIIREDGKILKGPNFTPPDLERLVHPVGAYA